MITYGGKVGAAVAIPVFAQLLASLDIPGLQGQIVGLGKAIAQVTFKPPSIGGTAIFAAKLLAAASVAVVPPVVQITASFEAKLALLKLKLELLLKIQDILAGGSFRLYEYEGQAGAFGTELGATLAGPDVDGGIAPAQQAFALVLLAEGGSAGEVTLKALRAGV